MLNVVLMRNQMAGKFFMFLLVLIVPITPCRNYTSSQCQFLFEDKQCYFAKCVFLNPFSHSSNSSQGDNWMDCLSLCCSYRVDPASLNIIDSLDNACEQAFNEDMVEIIIGLSFGIMAILGIILIFYCFGIDKLRQCFNDNQANLEISQLGIIDRLSANGSKAAKILHTETEIHFWDYEKNCSICLDQTTNILTQCGHQFHTACLRNWLRINRLCPECRSSEMLNFTIHCQKCSKSLKMIGCLLELQRDCSCQE